MRQNDQVAMGHSVQEDDLHHSFHRPKQARGMGDVMACKPRRQNRVVVLDCKMAINKAALHGHLDVIEWLHAFRDEGFSDWAFMGPIRHGHLSVLDWLHAQDDGCLYRMHLHPQLNRGLQEAVVKGRWDVLAWFRAHGPPEFLPYVAVIEAVATANMDAIEVVTVNNYFAQLAFQMAVMCGNVSLAEALRRPSFRMPPQVGNYYSVEFEIAVAASCGHLGMVHWWYTSDDMKPPTSNALRVVLVQMLHVGHQTVVEWLLFSITQSEILPVLNTFEPIRLIAFLARFPNLSESTRAKRSRLYFPRALVT
ncbi:Aste57867_10000 [Aphanomyces stellatus]|uniref:Aste57867_10000 protein n=1 Tax=Aphanomyces stellatus TaxID=120398 RepID=A0A485KPQ9_9STRA|nr:hypothetical protein As57867_009961 [Aphanomyces stellatus]VFT86878.1 Aste57867_10000 [Aphanomyces stellatus]